MVQNQSPKRVIVSESSSALSIKKNGETYATIKFILKQDELTVENKQVLSQIIFENKKQKFESSESYKV